MAGEPEEFSLFPPFSFFLENSSAPPAPRSLRNYRSFLLNHYEGPFLIFGLSSGIAITCTLPQRHRWSLFLCNRSVPRIFFWRDPVSVPRARFTFPGLVKDFFGRIDLPCYVKIAWSRTRHHFAPPCSEVESSLSPAGGSLVFFESAVFLSASGFGVLSLLSASLFFLLSEEQFIPPSATRRPPTRFSVLLCPPPY